MQAEFDLLADEYEAQHKVNIAISGEGPEYFAEYKIADLAASVRVRKLVGGHILDFGCGIGNSIPYFRKYFAESMVTCTDVSARSLQVAQTRFPGSETFVLSGNNIPLPDASQEIVFSACVFHHIPHEAHRYWLTELLRVTRPGGVLVIYEHNPLNPLTVRAVNTCPFDVNARLIRAKEMRRRALDAGWNKARVDYQIFFPAALKAFRRTEPYLSRLAFGAQYRLLARREV